MLSSKLVLSLAYPTKNQNFGWLGNDALTPWLVILKIGSSGWPSRVDRLPWMIWMAYWMWELGRPSGARIWCHLAPPCGASHKGPRFELRVESHESSFGHEEKNDASFCHKSQAAVQLAQVSGLMKDLVLCGHLMQVCLMLEGQTGPCGGHWDRSQAMQHPNRNGCQTYGNRLFGSISMLANYSVTCFLLVECMPC